MIHNHFFAHIGSLTDEQLDILRNDIYHIFFFQFQLSQHVLIDLRYVRENPISKYIQYICLSVHHAIYFRLPVIHNNMSML